MTPPRETRATPGRWWSVAFAVALLLQTWALYSPDPPSGPDLGLPLDKVVHLLAFAVVSWLGVRAGIPAGWVVAAMVVQAGLSEWVQRSVVTTRSGDWWDFAADLAGIVIGVTAALVQGRDRSHTRGYLPDGQ